MYQSPIEIITNQIAEKVINDLNQKVFTAVERIGININPEELIKALAYDRKQYECGYRDGYMAGQLTSYVIENAQERKNNDQDR